MNVMKHGVTRVLAGVLLSAVLLLITGCNIEEDMNEFLETAEFHTPDLSSLPDDTYKGKFRAGIVSAKVLVSVDSGRITEVEIKRHFNGQGEPAEVIVDDIVAAQSVEIDVVSGATYSSKVILKAVENALQSAAD